MFNFKQMKLKRLHKKIKALKANRLAEQPSDTALKKEIAYYFDLALVYEHLKSSKQFPFAQIARVEAYRAAADLGDAKAHHILGEQFLEEAKFRHQVQGEAIIDNDSNEQLMNQAYKLAHLHLEMASKLGHIHAKRLLGLCYINAWGVAADKEKGFELVVASIEQEGSWDQVPQIFESIGLNKPEFFAAIMKRKGTHQE